MAEAESRTTAQIVVAVAPRSGRYHRAADLFGLTLALVAVGAAWTLWQGSIPDTRDWQSGTVPILGLPSLLLFFATWFVAGALAATHWPALARPFMIRAERSLAVRRRGFEAFHTLHVRSTRHATGLLLYVSLFERTVWVCPDDAIAAKLGPEAWQPISDLVAEGFRSGNPGTALAKGVRAAGEILSKAFPGTGPRDNELPDAVRVLDDAKDS